MINPLHFRAMFAYPLRLAFSAWTDHIPFGMFLIELLKPRVLVELGTQYGVSYCAFCQAVHELHLATRCYAVDSWVGDEHSGMYGPDVLADLQRHHDLYYAGFSSLIHSTFDNAVQYFEDSSIDFLHIDGLHTYEAVRHDFETWLPKLSERSVVLFHDTNVRSNEFGVWRLWSELKKKYPYFELYHQHGLGLLAAGREPPEELNELISLNETEAQALREYFYFLADRIRVEQKRITAIADFRNQLEHARLEREAERAERQVLIDDQRGQIEADALQISGLAQQLAIIQQQLSEQQLKVEDLVEQNTTLQRLHLAELEAQRVTLEDRRRSELDAQNAKLEAQRISHERCHQLEREDLHTQIELLDGELRALRDQREEELTAVRVGAEARVATYEQAAARALAEVQKMRATRGWRLLEVWWKLRDRVIPTGTRRNHVYQTVRTGLALLFTEGPLAFVDRLRRWLRGERRYYRPIPAFQVAPEASAAQPAQISAPVSSDFHIPNALIPVSYVILLTGRLSEVEEDAAALLTAAERWAQEHPLHQVIVVADGAMWHYVGKRYGQHYALVAVSERACGLPGAVANAALQASTQEWVAFCLPGVESKKWFEGIAQLAVSLTEGMPRVAGVVGQLSQTDCSPRDLRSHRLHLDAAGNPDQRYLSPVVSGWLEMLDLVPLSNAILNRELLNELGGFSELPLMQYAFWWEAVLRLSRTAPFTTASVPCSKWRWALEDYPFSPDDPSQLTLDTTARLVVRDQSVVTETGRAKAAADLPEAAGALDVARVERYVPDDVRVKAAVEAIAPVWPVQPVRVTILGGENEPHHNQLFFLNYFGCLEGTGLLSWRSIDDTYATFADMDQADLIIFSRVRSTNGCRLIEYCGRIGKPTLYMLDDNWFTMGEEWPEYRELISPGSPFYENALHCIRSADSVLTFNPILEDYLKPHARRVLRMRCNIKTSLFREFITPRPHNGLLIGYAGSPRQGTLAFEALVEIALRHSDVTIFYAGWGMPVLLRSIPEHRIRTLPWTFSYTNYIRTMRELAPDIGIAPLGGTITERSKIATKYMEYACLECAGVYSRTEPYTYHVRHQETGWLTPGDTVADWVEAIEAVMDPGTRARIRKGAVAAVEEEFSTTTLMKDFLTMLVSVIRRA